MRKSLQYNSLSERTNPSRNFSNKYIIVIGIMLVVIVPMIFLRFDANPITGFISYESYEQAVDMELTESKLCIVSTKEPETLKITSFGISGEIIGDGQVEIYLQSNDKNLKIFENIKKIDYGLAQVTGMSVNDQSFNAPDLEQYRKIEPANFLVIKEQPDLVDLPHPEIKKGTELVSGKFSNEMDETSNIYMELSQKDVVRLVFNVEPGTQLNISNIIYTLDND